MIFASVTYNFTPVFNMQVGAFNQEKALVGAFSVIVKLQTSRRFVSSSVNTVRVIAN